jgi:GGDEF domain-containing protein
MHFLQETDGAPSHDCIRRRLRWEKISASELSLAGTFAEQTGLSIANIRLREALRSQSIREALTGLFNRRYLEETLERETHRTARANQSLTVTMLDIDHFKQLQ